MFNVIYSIPSRYKPMVTTRDKFFRNFFHFDSDLNGFREVFLLLVNAYAMNCVKTSIDRERDVEKERDGKLCVRVNSLTPSSRSHQSRHRITSKHNQHNQARDIFSAFSLFTDLSDWSIFVSNFHEISLAASCWTINESYETLLGTYSCEFPAKFFPTKLFTFFFFALEGAA